LFIITIDGKGDVDVDVNADEDVIKVYGCRENI
jgi:hypothetical protein